MLHNRKRDPKETAAAILIKGDGGGDRKSKTEKRDHRREMMEMAADDIYKAVKNDDPGLFKRALKAFVRMAADSKDD